MVAGAVAEHTFFRNDVIRLDAPEMLNIEESFVSGDAREMVSCAVGQCDHTSSSMNWLAAISLAAQSTERSEMLELVALVVPLAAEEADAGCSACPACGGTAVATTNRQIMC